MPKWPVVWVGAKRGVDDSRPLCATNPEDWWLLEEAEDFEVAEYILTSALLGEEAIEAVAVRLYEEERSRDPGWPEWESHEHKAPWRQQAAENLEAAIAAASKEGEA